MHLQDNLTNLKSRRPPPPTKPPPKLENNFPLAPQMSAFHYQLRILINWGTIVIDA